MYNCHVHVPNEFIDTFVSFWMGQQSHDFDLVDPEDTTPQPVERRSRKRHSTSPCPRRPWRDPDKHPNDIHCRTEFLSTVPSGRR